MPRFDHNNLFIRYILDADMNQNIEVLKGEQCPLCHKNTLTLTEYATEVPHFGIVHVFGMDCENKECNYHLQDIEPETAGKATKYTIEISSEEDMKIRVVKSSKAVVKIPHVTTIEPGPASSGYITNIEGILNRVKVQIEKARDTEEDNAIKKKAKALLKKLQKVMWGQDKLKIIIEDPTGNSAIVAEKVEKK